MAIIYHNGKIKADNVEIKGKVTATSGEFSGKVYATDGEFKGKINIGNGAIVLNKDGSGSIGNAGTYWQDNGVLHVNHLSVDMIWGFNQLGQILNNTIEPWNNAAVFWLSLPTNETIKLPASPCSNYPYRIINLSSYQKEINGNGHNIWCKGSEYSTIYMSPWTDRPPRYLSVKTLTLIFDGKWYVVGAF